MAVNGQGRVAATSDRNRYYPTASAGCDGLCTMGEAITIELLGGLHVIAGEREITRFPTQKTGALLGYLAFFLGRSHPREALVELLWPDVTPESGRNSLSVALSSLRHHLEPPGVASGTVIQADRFSVCLNAQVVQTDVARFELAVRRARGGSEQAHLLAEAVELYRGPLMHGYYEDWVLAERRRLADLYFHEVRRLAGMAEQSGDITKALELARLAVMADSLHEEAQQQLIRLYAAAGQQAAALEQYREMERLLRAELGRGPSSASRSLAKTIEAAAPSVQLATPVRPTDAAIRIRAEENQPSGPPDGAAQSVPATATRPVRLPVPLTRFFGREHELEQLCGIHASRHRLITLIGPGGTGKTRLAIEAARRLQETYAGAVWLIPLADIDDACLLLGAALDALEVVREAGRDPLAQIVDAIAGRDVLLLLDNFEQIADAGAPIVQALLERAPTLHCLVSSRRALGIAGEKPFPVHPLPVPERQRAGTPDQLMRLASVQLFVDRARSVRPDFQITGHNAAAIAELCERLEGIPLAIELAAGRAQVLTPAQMVAQLGQRFELLVSRQRAASERHRTLRAAIDWSYRLLPPDVRRFFAQISVFRGGCSAEGAEQVCTEPLALDHLAHLAECSLVHSVECPDGMRFRMLEMLREYAWEQLSPEERCGVQSRHAAYYLALAEAAEPQLTGPDQAAWLDWLEQEHDNLRAALDYCAAGTTVDSGLRLAAALWPFWRVRGYWREGYERLRKHLELTRGAGRSRTRVAALVGCCYLGGSLGEHDAVMPLYEEALAAARAIGDLRGIADALHVGGNLAFDLGQVMEARRRHEEALRIRRCMDDRVNIAYSLLNLGNHVLGSSPSEAREYYSECLSYWRECGHRKGVAVALNNLGEAARLEGDLSSARSLYEQSLAIYRELGDLPGVAMALGNLGDVARRQGDYRAASSACVESLAIRWRIGDRRGTASCLEDFGTIAALQGQELRAASLFGAADAVFDAMGLPPRDPEDGYYNPIFAEMKTRIEESAIGDAWKSGRAMPLPDAVRYVLEHGDASNTCSKSS